MPTLYAELEIEAPRSRVWKALYHKQKWYRWNTFLFDCDPVHPFTLGAETSLSLRRFPEEEETEFQPLVTVLQPEVCLAWVSQIRGFRNEYVFELMDIGIDRTRYVHRNIFSGFLTPVFLPFIREDEQQAIKRMARDLKRYVERKRD